MRFWVQMRYLVEIEILIFSDTYISLEYTCEISVRYLKRFLRNRQKFIGPYDGHGIVYSVCDVNVNFLIHVNNLASLFQDV